MDGLPDADRADLYERPDVWLEANARFRENDSYTEMATKIRPEVREIVFTAPDRATVRFALLSDEVLAPGEQVGEAVLIDGTWKVSIETACALHRLGGVECEL